MARDYTKIGHHIIFRKERGDFNIDDPRNIINLKKYKEQGFHNFVGPYGQPRDQVRLFHRMIKNVASPYVNKLFEIINKIPEEERYGDGLLKTKKKKHRKHQ